MKYFFLALIIILPFQFALNIGDSLDLEITRILVPLIFFLWLIGSLARKKIWVPNRVETWLLISFLFFLIVSVFLEDEPEKGFRALLYFFTIIPLFWVAVDIFRNDRFKVLALKAIIISGTLAAALGIIQFLLQFIIGLDAELKYIRNFTPFFLGQSFGKLVENNPSWLVNISGTTLMRSFGFFPDPHAFSFFVSLCFFVSLGYVFSGKKEAFFYFAVFGVLSMFFAVIFSFARGAYLGMAAGIVFFAAATARGRKWLGKGLIIMGILIIIAVFLSPPTVSQRFVSAFNLKEGSNAERIKNWKQATEIVFSHPLFGVGPGNYAVQIDPTAGEQSSIYAHNTFLDVAAETGIINGMAFMLLIFISIAHAIKKGNALGFGLAAGLVYFLVHTIFDTPIWSPQVMTMFLLVLAMGINAKISNYKFPATKDLAGGQN